MSGVINDYVSNNLNLSRLKSEANTFKSLTKSLSLGVDKEKNDAKLLKAAQDFEAVFINQLLQVMDKTVQRSDFMHGGQGEKIFREMFYQEIAKDISNNSLSNFGLGKQIYEQLSKYQ